MKAVYEEILICLNNGIGYTVAYISGLCLLVAERCVYIVYHLNIIPIGLRENKITTLIVVLGCSEIVQQQSCKSVKSSEFCRGLVLVKRRTVS